MLQQESKRSSSYCNFGRLDILLTFQNDTRLAVSLKTYRLESSYSVLVITRLKNTFTSSEELNLLRGSFSRLTEFYLVVIIFMADNVLLITLGCFFCHGRMDVN